MKYCAAIFVLVQVALIQSTCGQVIRTAAVASPVIAQQSVANSLADTLSLLTVSSLLSETLPFNSNIIAAIPVASPVVSPVIAYDGCGCGSCGCGYRNYPYNYLY